MSEDWTRQEVEATVADYFHMLTLELAGQQYSKTEHRGKLLQLLSSRSEAAIEMKHRNISAILIELGCQYIAGYKLLRNYQGLLYDVVAERVQHDARNLSLGRAGEEFVVNYERWRLVSSGKQKLAEKVEHVSSTQGDGLGYDVLSFEITGSPKLIEVKTTSSGKETPFFISHTEVELSKSEPEVFHLYRLFAFRREPRLFSLGGAIDQHCRLDPMTFRAGFS